MAKHVAVEKYFTLQTPLSQASSESDALFSQFLKPDSYPDIQLISSELQQLKPLWQWFNAHSDKLDGYNGQSVKQTKKELETKMTKLKAKIKEYILSTSQSQRDYGFDFIKNIKVDLEDMTNYVKKVNKDNS